MNEWMIYAAGTWDVSKSVQQSTECSASPSCSASGGIFNVHARIVDRMPGKIGAFCSGILAYQAASRVRIMESVAAISREECIKAEGRIKKSRIKIEKRNPYLTFLYTEYARSRVYY